MNYLHMRGPRSVRRVADPGDGWVIIANPNWKRFVNIGRHRISKSSVQLQPEFHRHLQVGELCFIEGCCWRLSMVNPWTGFACYNPQRIRFAHEPTFPTGVRRFFWRSILSIG